MKKPPHFESLGEFDHYCKKALEHEAIDYLREMGKLRSRQKSLSSLTQEEMARLSSEDSYPSSSYVFSAHGYNLLIDNEMVAEAFAELEEQGLVVTEPTSVMTKDGRKRNGSLRYTILPIRNAVDLHNQRQLRQLEETTERMRVGKKLEAIKEHPA